MTPEQETRIRKILGDWPEHNTWAEIDQVFTLLKAQIEHLEFQAHNNGQDHQIELHKEHLEATGTTCTWRDWAED